MAAADKVVAERPCCIELVLVLVSSSGPGGRIVAPKPKELVERVGFRLRLPGDLALLRRWRRGAFGSLGCHEKGGVVLARQELVSLLGRVVDVPDMLPEALVEAGCDVDADEGLQVAGEGGLDDLEHGISALHRRAGSCEGGHAADEVGLFLLASSELCSVPSAHVGDSRHVRAGDQRDIP